MEGSNDRIEAPATSPEPLDHIIAHDLNNYLNIIQGQADLLLGDVDDPGIVERLTTIKRQAIAANSMLQAVGGLTRGNAQGEFDVVDVGSMLSIEVDRLRSAYQGATISADIDENVPVQADDLLSSVFANIVENAIKHNDSPTPTVHVKVTTRNGAAVVSVEDNGPGLPDDVRDQLLGKDLAHPQTGVHIIRSLVERYGGDISLETSQEGSKISVELPRARE